MGLINALLASSGIDEGDWSNLWMAVMVKKHMVISDPVTNEVFYVISSREHSISCLALLPTEDDLVWSMVPDRRAIRAWAPVTSLHAFRCHDYMLEMTHTRTGPRIAAKMKTQEGETMLKFCCRNLLMGFRLEDLKALAKAAELTLPKMAKHTDVAEALLANSGIDGVEKENILQTLRAKLAKRARKSTKDRQGADGEGAAATEAQGAGEENMDSDKEELVSGNPFVRSLPEEEVAFACGEVPAGFALDEEENDEGLDAIAAEAHVVVTEASAVPPARARNLKSTTPPASFATVMVASASASSSSGLGPPAQPAPMPATSGASSSSGLLPPVQPPAGDTPLADSEGAPPAPIVPQVRMPNLLEVEAPAGCSLRLYPGAKGADSFRWIARLPEGSAPFEGTHSKSRSFKNGESGAREKLVCLQYLQRWWDSQWLVPQAIAHPLILQC